MQISDEAKLFAIREKLMLAERSLYEANKILAFVFEGGNSGHTVVSVPTNPISPTSDRDPVTGLYPGQYPDPTLVCELPEEGVECVE